MLEDLTLGAGSVYIVPVAGHRRRDTGHLMSTRFILGLSIPGLFQI